MSLWHNVGCSRLFQQVFSFHPRISPYTAKIVANRFCREVVHLHGIPQSILSDRDVIFLNAFWQELFRLSKTRLRMGMSYHPQSDGQIQVINRCLESQLRCFCYGVTSYMELTWAKFSFHTGRIFFKTGFHSSIETTLFCFYGRDPPSFSPFIHKENASLNLKNNF